MSETTTKQPKPKTNKKKYIIYGIFDNRQAVRDYAKMLDNRTTTRAGAEQKP